MLMNNGMCEKELVWGFLFSVKIDTKGKSMKNNSGQPVNSPRERIAHLGPLWYHEKNVHRWRISDGRNIYNHTH